MAIFQSSVERDLIEKMNSFLNSKDKFCGNPPSIELQSNYRQSNSESVNSIHTHLSHL